MFVNETPASQGSSEIVQTLEMFFFFCNFWSKYWTFWLENGIFVRPTQPAIWLAFMVNLVWLEDLIHKQERLRCALKETVDATNNGSNCGFRSPTYKNNLNLQPVIRHREMF